MAAELGFQRSEMNSEKLAGTATENRKNRRLWFVCFFLLLFFWVVWACFCWCFFAFCLSYTWLFIWVLTWQVPIWTCLVLNPSWKNGMRTTIFFDFLFCCCPFLIKWLGHPSAWVEELVSWACWKFEDEKFWTLLTWCGNDGSKARPPKKMLNAVVTSYSYGNIYVLDYLSIW